VKKGRHRRFEEARKLKQTTSTRRSPNATAGWTRTTTRTKSPTKT